MQPKDRYADIVLQERNDYRDALYVLYGIAVGCGNAMTAKYIASVLRLTSLRSIREETTIEIELPNGRNCETSQTD